MLHTINARLPCIVVLSAGLARRREGQRSRDDHEDRDLQRTHARKHMPISAKRSTEHATERTDPQPESHVA
jgi:hypothetical protein